MKLPEEELIEEYLCGEIIDELEHDEFALSKLHEMIGDEEDNEEF